MCSQLVMEDEKSGVEKGGGWGSTRTTANGRVDTNKCCALLGEPMLSLQRPFCADVYVHKRTKTT